MRKNAFLNIFFSLLLQIAALISGIIVPRLILVTFGSNINGLVSSITQFLNYITILEGGLGSVVLAALYKAIALNDTKKINSIMSATKSFFRKIAFIYIAYTVILSLVYPIYVKAELSSRDISLLVLVISFTTFIQYMFSAPYRLLIIANQRGYVTYIVHIIIIFINIIGVIISVKLFRNIHIVKLVQALAFILQPLVFNAYVKKNFAIDVSIKPDKESISQRWDGFGQNLAFFIHSNTDVLVLTIFSSLEVVSVYTVYMLFIKSLNSLISSLSSGFSPTIGKTLAEKDGKKVNQLFDAYELGMWLVSVILFGTCIILIVPTVSLYTKQVTDANYIQPIFAIIMSLAEMTYCVRNPYINVIYNSGHFRQTAKYAYIEAILNIMISIILVYHLDLIGVAIGTLVSMSYRMVMSAIYLRHNILNRSFLKMLKKVFIFIPAGFFGIYISRLIIPSTINNIGLWIRGGVTSIIVLSTFVLLVAFLFERNTFGFLVKLFIKK